MHGERIKIILYYYTLYYYKTISHSSTVQYMTLDGTVNITRNECTNIKLLLSVT